RTVKQSESTAKKPRGKPFEKRHVYAWKPGQSGNPAGRPKARTLSEELRAKLQEQYPGRDDVTYGQMLTHKLIEIAIAGDRGAIKECFDRVDGKSRQPVNLVDVNVDNDREAIEKIIVSVIEDHAELGQTITREEAIVFIQQTKVGQDSRAQRVLKELTHGT